MLDGGRQMSFLVGLLTIRVHGTKDGVIHQTQKVFSSSLMSYFFFKYIYNLLLFSKTCVKMVFVNNLGVCYRFETKSSNSISVQYSYCILNHIQMPFFFITMFRLKITYYNKHDYLYPVYTIIRQRINKSNRYF